MVPVRRPLVRACASDAPANVLPNQEDCLLRSLVDQHGARTWSVIAKHIAGRSSKSCRLR